MVTTDYDAIVIGAGPAGSMAAWEFASAGWRVLLLDRQKFPREKACGGALTARAVKALPFSMASVTERLVVWQTTNALTNSSVFHVYPKTRLHMTSRFLFDALLVEQAVACGAIFHGQEAVRSVTDSGSEVTVTTHLGAYRARCAVLACGAGLGLAADGRLKAVERPAAFALEGRIEVISPQVPDTVMQIAEFDYRFPLAGYSWVFPKNNYLNVGIGTFDLAHVPVTKAALYEHFSGLASMLGSKVSGVRGAPLGIGGLLYMPKGRVLRAGDAAGFTSDASGEGISPAIVTGRLAARAFIQCGRDGDGAAAIYSGYLRPIRKWLQAALADSGRLYGL